MYCGKDIFLEIYPRENQESIVCYKLSKSEQPDGITVLYRYTNTTIMLNNFRTTSQKLDAGFDTIIQKKIVAP